MNLFKMKTDKTDIDFSKFEVGKIYRICLKNKEIDTDIPRALIKDVDIENNEITIEPLIDRETKTNQEISYPFSIKMVDKDGKVMFDTSR